MPDNSTARNSLIFRSTLLPYSETFIANQAENFQIFTPYYAGYRHEKGFNLPPDRVIPFSNSKAVGRFRNLAATLGFADPWYKRTVQGIGPELIHAHFEDSGIKAVPLARYLKVPLFVTYHGCDKVEGRRWENVPVLGKVFQRRRSAMFKTASLCLGVSRFICDQMLQMGYPADKVRLHYIGVDTERFQPDPSVPGQPVILFVGRLVEPKGCGYLIKAMGLVRHKFPDVKLVIIGDGSLKSHLEKLATEERINVSFLGRQSPERIKQWMRESMLFCLPSVPSADGNGETLGLVTLEAQASGLPVVATRTGGIPEAVEHGVTGLLSGGRDFGAMAENILTLLSNSDLRARMGLAARSRVVDQFDLKHQTALLEKIYLEFL